MRRFFIDCGANGGNTLDVFKRSVECTPDTLLYAIEPDPRLIVRLRQRGDCVVIGKCIWTNDGTVGMYFDSRRTGLRNTQFKTGSHRMPSEPTPVECMNFGAWLVATCDVTDHVIVKMDVQGAEYAVLEQMLADGSIGYVDKLSLELLHRKQAHMSAPQNTALVARLNGVGRLQLCLDPLETFEEGYRNTWYGRRGRPEPQ